MWAIVCQLLVWRKDGVSVTSGALVEEGKLSVDTVEHQPERPEGRTQRRERRLSRGRPVWRALLRGWAGEPKLPTGCLGEVVVSDPERK